MKRRTVILLLQLLPAGGIVLLWQLMAGRNPGNEFMVGAPSGIYRELVSLLRAGNLLHHCWITALEAALGFFSGTILGTLIGLSLWASHTLFTITKPYLIALGAIPAFALGPVLVFWFGTGLWSKVVLGFLSTFFIALGQAYTGACEVDPNLLRLVRAFGGTRRQIYVRIVLPSATIWVLSGVRLNIGMALLGAFVGEFISSRAGLGYLIIQAEGLYNVNQIWAGVVCIMALAVFFNCCTIPVERWANRWKQ